MNSDSKVFQIQDEADLIHDKTIRKQLKSDEKILLSCNVNKHNNRGVVQERTLLITDRFCYNIAFSDFFAQVLSIINPASVIKRKIAIESICAITVSNYYLCDQFIIHVDNEHDYRYSGISKKRDSILSAICYAYRLKTGRSIPFYFKEEADLASYQNHENDIKNNRNKRPTGEALFLSDEDLTMGLNFFSKNKSQILKNRKRSENAQKNGTEIRRAATIAFGAEFKGDFYDSHKMYVDQMQDRSASGGGHNIIQRSPDPDPTYILNNYQIPNQGLQNQHIDSSTSTKVRLDFESELKTEQRNSQLANTNNAQNNQFNAFQRMPEAEYYKNEGMDFNMIPQTSSVIIRRPQKPS